MLKHVVHKVTTLGFQRGYLFRTKATVLALVCTQKTTVSLSLQPRSLAVIFWAGRRRRRCNSLGLSLVTG